MKNQLKKIIPSWFINWRRKKLSKFRDMSPQETFRHIYETNHWNSKESISGGGSEINQTITLIKDLEEIISDKKITSLLDVPCGDFNWMKEVNMPSTQYIGGDIVEDLIKRNSENFKDRTNVTFKVVDLIKDPLPQSDLIFVRDCLVHLSYDNIFSAIQNIKSSGCKYLMTTTFTECDKNTDIVTGNWRKINLEKKPFNFPKPLLIINENCTEGNGLNKDKSMGIWEISAL
ncbi:class I SAM-dependent methyltransferase [Flavobacterium silvisoli]|uniref:Class I SAM-dependent methyltransferase n=1 Tax=Flavobacterium silvisoli TaxID=2529433 RepID=A0A4Q9YS25_9FLAO|nr:class I SAM-dependent methyltransferase [Flavobacterium silvisoli]TBX66361.1 class I SAM-dependent methyltransferase [Flavobacterium silvisoli]